MSFITENSTSMLWGLGILWVAGLLVIWSYLAMSKKCEEEA